MTKSRRAKILPAMWSRMLKVLAVGVLPGHDSIVLGAWGCGAFGNDSVEIARLFRQALAENFRGAYSQVIFAVLDWSREKWFIGPFQRAFEGCVTTHPIGVAHRLVESYTVVGYLWEQASMGTPPDFPPSCFPQAPVRADDLRYVVDTLRRGYCCARPAPLRPSHDPPRDDTA
jgi:hypothetical protein